MAARRRRRDQDREGGVMTTTVLPMRLALRAEGAMWNAYLAKADDMQDAVWIGSIAMYAIEDNPERKQAFQALMTGIIADAIEELTGRRPQWMERPAPDDDRTR